MSTRTLTITLQNQTTSDNVYAHVSGIPVDNSKGNLFFLLADGKTACYPTSPAQDQTPVAENIAIPLASPGSSNPTQITIPQLAGARISFSIDTPLKFFLNKGPALVEPSITNPSDQNYNTFWDFCELTFNNDGLFANITYVDFVSIPIALSLTNASGVTTNVAGLPANGLDTICDAIKAQNDSPDWTSLIYPATGTPLRVLSPNSLSAVDGTKFAGYWESYVGSVWSQYQSQTLTVDTQGAAGKLAGNVINENFTFTGNGQTISFTKPSSRDVFSCNTGPFGGLGNTLAGNLAARICAAFNRSTIDTNPNQPNGENPATYYVRKTATQDSPTNQYSRIVHDANLDHKGYAFPYDDVVPDAGADQAGIVSDGNPVTFVVTVGGGGVSAPVQGGQKVFQ